jgi:hypothetical protein
MMNTVIATHVVARPRTDVARPGIAQKSLLAFCLSGWV